MPNKTCSLCGKEHREQRDACSNCKKKEVTTSRNKPKKKLNKLIVMYLILCGLLVILGIGSTFLVKHYKQTRNETEVAFWQECVQKNNSLEYSKYLIRFPEGVYADEAQKRIMNFRLQEDTEASVKQ